MPKANIKGEVVTTPLHKQGSTVCSVIRGLMYLIKVGNCLSYLKDMVSLSSLAPSRSGLRLADTDAFSYVVPRSHTKLVERAFSSSRPTAWNKLPESIRTDNDTKSFKRNLKTHLFIAACN